METDFLEWMYLKLLVGNFESLYQYYFHNMAFMAPYFRQGAVGILYSVGLAWAAVCFLKSPVDKLLTGIAVLGMVFVAGFLVSPTTNTKHLGRAAGTELSVGGYYSFVVAGTITNVFDNIVAASWKATVSGAVNGGGPSREALAMAYNDKAEIFAEKFLNGEGRAAVLDFQQQCGSEALKQATSDKDKAILRSVGIGANTLGMEVGDATTLGQYTARANNDNFDWQTLAMKTLDFTKLSPIVLTTIEANKLNNRRTEAVSYLKNLPPANSQIDGTKGYRIPTSNYYKNKLSNNGASDESSSDAFKSVSSSGSDFQKMLPIGATATEPNTQGDYVFYPKNCYDLYLIANETMKSLRTGAKGVPGYENLELAQAYVSLSAANAVRRGINDAMNKELQQAGSTEKYDESLVEAFGDTIYQGAAEISSKYDKWMLEYKIPTMISSMAMIVALLLLTFPVFAVVSVIFGHKVLVSFFKLMAFPFIVVFINNLLLSLSANLIAYNKGFQAITNTFDPGGVDVASSISVMSAESIIYTVITIAEVAIAKFILWDDVRAITSFNPGAAGTQAAARGAAMVGAVASLVTGVLGRGARMAAATKAGGATKALNQTVSAISQQVSQIANAGGGAQNRRGNLGQGQQGGSGSGSGSGGKSTGGTKPTGDKPSGGGGGGGNPLVPPQPPKPSE
ncbi:hypothetical protein PSOLE_33220 [Pseudomonas oleovorans subsp. oleovorans]|uniref:Uncharacterized protein n=1 Tax=Ectopseudomonas oleovorans TaxID=301 RepID=A0A379PJQ5_ECTOL|nr:hypothetical protein [Pseudomonas oleovorans]OWK41563.1 hypothetical protein PSOLE_33220 [Pseudomonas oleovorans subsp. oleovorans]SEJ35107.1 hypothetical protein SAMN05216280_101952 [Pseudomonas oleovorans]SUE72365.1 Uncharacterised protein [Pseudomonas oleovorans]